MPGTSGPPASLATEVAVLRAELDALKKLSDERREADRDALKLQAAEYERRLAALNHEADQLRRMQATYLPREVYEAEARELRSRAEALKLTAAEHTGAAQSLGTRVAELAAGLNWLGRLVVGAVIVALIAWGFQALKR